VRELPRPFLKWAGGKTRLLAELSRQLPDHFNIYHEPFLGGGALFFHLVARRRVRRAILSDINGTLVETYLGLRDELEEVLRHLREHAGCHDRDHYYRTRDQDPDSEDRAARAARFIYLNRTCYNGLYRESRSGRFNVPMGRYANPNICNESLLRAASAALSTAEIVCTPFSTAASRAMAGDLVYMDPPYQPLTSTSSFTAYHRGGFDESEQHHLGRVFRQLAQRGVQVVLSNSDTDLVRLIYAGLPQEQVQVARSINSRASGRGAVAELIVRGGPGFLDTPHGEG
jgi:DNA adenine methylase